MNMNSLYINFITMCNLFFLGSYRKIKWKDYQIIKDQIGITSIMMFEVDTVNFIFFNYQKPFKNLAINKSMSQ